MKIYIEKLSSKDERYFKSNLSLLPKQKLEQVNRVLSVSAKKQTIMAWSMLKIALRDDYGIEDFELKFGENKKPYLKNGEVFFSLSHSGDYVVCVIDKAEIGVDIQVVKPYDEKLAKRFFNEKEVELLEKSDFKDEHFTKLWTLKESYLKQTGEGIGSKLNELNFSENFEQEKFEAFGKSFLVVIRENYIISICTNQIS